MFLKVKGSGFRSALSMGLKLGGAAMAFVFYAQISRLVATDRAGVFFWAIAFSLAASTVTRVGLDFAVIKLVSQEKDGLRNSALRSEMYMVILLSFLFSMALCLLFLIFRNPILAFCNLPKDSTLLVLIMIFAIGPISVYMIIASILNGLERNVSASFLQTGMQQCLVVVILFSLTHLYSDTELAIAWSYFLAACFTALYSIFLLVQCSGFPKLKELRTSNGINTLRASIPLWPGALADMAINALPTTLVGIASTPSSVALFSVPQRIASVVYFGFASINAVAAPQIGRAIKMGVGAGDIYRRFTRMMIITVIPGCFFLGAIGKPVLSVFGNEYRDAFYVLLFLLSAQVIHALFGPTLMLLIMSDRRRAYSCAMFLGAAVTFSMTLILAYWHGAQGAAAGVFLGVLAQKMLGFVLARPVRSDFSTDPK
ncbi:hypothetical protein WQQ_26420 [Hydrocarboniphaga effusa AP103]|uniref:Polysaccharide biosynthesis protein C-terminal domain-containing protein n=2 Tax=Hydrocarboniphaga effusa TaxID=243629 RepID=I8T578_9GAMM|nr:hypothetical protein WQQ_26420 [Hydrocarboniphaga effusa AP103]